MDHDEGNRKRSSKGFQRLMKDIDPRKEVYHEGKIPSSALLGL